MGDFEGIGGTLRGAASSTEVIETQTHGRRRSLRMPTFVVGLLAVALVGGLIGRGLLFGDGGASSPEDAVRQLGTAISNEDLVGALAALAPDEVRDVADTYSSASAKLTSLGVAPKDKTLGGIDLDVSGLQLTTTNLGPDVAKVEVEQGTVSFRVTEHDLGTKVQEMLSEDARSRPGHSAARSITHSGSKDLAHLTHRERDGVRHPAFLIAVRRDGGWYVSPFYTVAELLDSNSNRPRGDFTPVQSGPAAPTPTGAVDQLITAINHRDVDAGIGSLSADEWAVLDSYRAAIHAAVDSKLKGGADDFQIDGSKLTSQPINDSAQKVFIESLSGHVTTHHVSQKDRAAYRDALHSAIDQASAPGNFDVDVNSIPRPKPTARRVTWSFAGGCLKVDDPDGPSDSCRPSRSGATDFVDVGYYAAGPLGVFGRLDGRSALNEADSLAGHRPYVIVVAERNGWAVSPVATVMSWLRASIDKIDGNTVARFTGTELDAPPSGSLTGTGTTRATFNSAGFVTVAYRGTRGTPFELKVDGAEVVSQVRMPDGEAQYEFGDDPIFPSADGVERILLYGRTGKSVAVSIHELTDLPAVSLGQSAVLHMDADGTPQIVAIKVVKGQHVRIDPGSNLDLDVFRADGRQVRATEGYDGRDWSYSNDDSAVSVTTAQESETFYASVSLTTYAQARPDVASLLDERVSADDPRLYFAQGGSSYTLNVPFSDATPSEPASSPVEDLHVAAGVPATVTLAVDPTVQGGGFGLTCSQDDHSQYPASTPTPFTDHDTVEVEPDGTWFDLIFDIGPSGAGASIKLPISPVAQTCFADLVAATGTGTATVSATG